jgi:hypothetical protein
LFVNYRDTFKPAAFDFSLAENEGILEPETARSYEGGVKLRSGRGRFDLEAIGFRMDFKNLVTATVVGGLPSLQNAGSTVSRDLRRRRRPRAPRYHWSRHLQALRRQFVDFAGRAGAIPARGQALRDVGAICSRRSDRRPALEWPACHRSTWGRY